MEVKFTKQFSKQLDRKIPAHIKKRLVKIIQDLEECDHLFDVQNVSALKGYKDFYRIRIGSYRIGLQVE